MIDVSDQLVNEDLGLQGPTFGPKKMVKEDVGYFKFLLLLHHLF